MQTLLVMRPGNAELSAQEQEDFSVIQDFSSLHAKAENVTETEKGQKEEPETKKAKQ